MFFDADVIFIWRKALNVSVCILDDDASVFYVNVDIYDVQFSFYIYRETFYLDRISYSLVLMIDEMIV